MLPLTISLALTLFSSTWVFVLTREKKVILLHLILTIISPWFLILASGQYPFGIESEKLLKCNLASSARACFLSVEALYFVGDPRTGLHIEDQGFLLLSTLPLLIVGLYTSFRNIKVAYKVTILTILLVAIISFSIDIHPNLGSSLIYLPLLGIFTTLGAYQYLNNFLQKGVFVKVKFLIIVNVSWLLYESLRLYQILIFHKPFQI